MLFAIFTNMQQQLFLFETPAEKPPVSEQPLTEAVPPTTGETDIATTEALLQTINQHANSKAEAATETGAEDDVAENETAFETTSEEDVIATVFTPSANETAEITNSGNLPEAKIEEQPEIVLFAPSANETEEPTITDPFEAEDKKREEQVENMLLLPNTRRGRKSFKDMDAEVILVDVPDDEELYKKQYYPMRVVAEWFGITPSQLRNWENEFDILKPKKNAKGDRFFRPDDVKNIQLIYHLIRRRKFTVQGAKQYLAENKKNLQATMQLTDSLNKIKQFLTELKAITG